MVSLQKASPGQVAAVFYSDDTYWHERLLLWPFRDSKWMIYTPDGDRYLEDLSGTDSEGPNRVKVKGEDFQWWLEWVALHTASHIIQPMINSRP